MSDNLLKTPLHAKHLELRGKMVPFGGWDMPLEYTGILDEHGACRSDVVVFDTSHMGRFSFKGDLMNSGINEATTVAVDKLKIGKCKYGFLLNENGTTLDDLLIYKISDDELLIVVNAGTTPKDLEVFKSRITSGILEKLPDDHIKMDVQGPRSKEILQQYFDFNLDELKFFSFTHTNMKSDSNTIILSRTGYTGELGFELYTPKETGLAIWDKLIKDGVKPAGLGSRDVLRLEVGMSLYGNELSESITPIEASLDKFVNFNTEFVGKKILEDQVANGPAKKLYPFVTNSRQTARKGFKVCQADQEIGYVTSGVYSPIKKSSIGFAMVETEKFDVEKPLVLTDGRRSIEADVTALPFI